MSQSSHTNTKIIQNKALSLSEALIPIIVLIALLAFNVGVYGDDALSGSNQFILLLGGAVAALVGFQNKVSYKNMMDEVANNIHSTSGALLILLFVGALAGAWLISGIIPTMIFYGLKLLNPTIFLPATVLICALISIATGSSWTTSATVGIALVGIGKAIGLPSGMVAGAAISGAYFGDKLSPLSDTTNLAAAMAGSTLFTHIRYMLYTTVPSICITLIVFSIMGIQYEVGEETNVEMMLESIQNTFVVSPWLFLVPIVVIIMIVKKTQPLIALLTGTLLAVVFAIFFQPHLIAQLSGTTTLEFSETYKVLMNAMTAETIIETTNPQLNDLFSSGGMSGMLGTIWLIVCAMVFGGIMEAIGALTRISQSLLSWAKSTFSLFASTVASCLAVNITASDQYLAIVIPGKMFKKAFADKKLAPENLSRTLEDSGTVTSVLIPWNTCGAYQSGVLGVSVADYFVYAIFNWISPLMTLLYALLALKIRQTVA